MIELEKDQLIFSFPEVHADAVLRIELQRTLRIPDDARSYPLPPGLGRFPMRHVDDCASRVPAEWLRHGGVMLPMYQSEALWINFCGDYPFAIKVAAGKINAVTGDEWTPGLHRDPQDYVVAPDQPWLDGYCVGEGVVRQFVAMPLGSGYSAEEQLTGAAEFGGLQLLVQPMKASHYERLLKGQRRHSGMDEVSIMGVVTAAAPDMGLAPGGRMRQEIYDDDHPLSAWESQSSRCFVHLANSLAWRAITQSEPPKTPATAKAYTKAGLPWFEYYAADAKALPGSETLGRLKSVAAMARQKRDVPICDNESLAPGNVVALRKGLLPGQVREGSF